jgi:hypothetical protein
LCNGDHFGDPFSTKDRPGAGRSCSRENKTAPAHAEAQFKNAVKSIVGTLPNVPLKNKNDPVTA